MIVVATRITVPFSKIIEEYIHRGVHVTPSDLLRDALRDKIKRDAPDLYAELFNEASE